MKRLPLYATLSLLPSFLTAWQPSAWQPQQPPGAWQSPQRPAWQPQHSGRPQQFSSHPSYSNSIEQAPQAVVSNYPPVLQVSSSEGYLDENAEIGTTVRVAPHSHAESLQILVSDPDLKAGMSPATYQYVLTGLGATIFAVDQRGFVYLNVNSIDGDPPSPSSYQLSVQAREVDTVPVRNSSAVTITIHIIDANDNEPQFELPIYTVAIPANGGKRPVIRVVATDKDSGIYGVVRHNVSQVDGVEGSQQFSYDEDTKTLMVEGDLQEGHPYQVVVNARDGGGAASQSIVIVTPFSLPSRTPAYSTDEETIQTIVTEIPENTPHGTLVVQLGEDSSPLDLVYSIEGGNEDEHFHINPNTGAIRTVGEMDREENPLFSLQVETRSTGNQQHLYWTLVQIALTDANDNPPVFVGTQPLRVEFVVKDLSDMRRDVEVGRVRVEDRDHEDNGRLTLGVLAPNDRLFTIDNYGVLSVNGDFTAQHIGDHRIMVFARDHGEPPRESLASLIVSIRTAPNIEVITERPPMSMTDPPRTTPTTATDRPKDSSLLSMLSSLGVSSPSPSPPSPPSPPSSPSSPSFPSTRIAPVFSPSSLSVSIDENREDVEIAKVSASYPDGSPGSVSYVLLTGEEGTFAVDSFTGGIRLIQPLDAETDKSIVIVIGTRESSSLRTSASLSHNATVRVIVGDANDWIPAFETSHYAFTVNADTLPGTIIGQVIAYDEDRDSPNNDLRYSLSGGGDGRFSVNPDTGLISLARPVDQLDGQLITLGVEVVDGGSPSHRADTVVTIRVEGPSSGQESPTPARTMHGTIHFTQKNFSATVSESTRPPHLVMVLPVENKPVDTRFLSCSIVSGNFRGAFGITANNGNCELRTQMELDRESVERHLLNVSVASSSGEWSSALVSVTVLDSNDNMPVFEYENDLSLTEYLCTISSEAGAFTRVAVVKATDADVGNSSLVRYSLDPMSLHSKYFSISQSGEITTRQSMPQLLHAAKYDKFELKVLACDSPLTGHPLCARTEVTVFVVRDGNRFKMATTGLHPAQIPPHKMDMIRSLRASTGGCSFLSLESLSELPPSSDGRPRTNITWVAIDHVAKRACTTHEMGNDDYFRGLFSSSSVSAVGGKLRPWMTVEGIEEEGEQLTRVDTLDRVEWKGASAVLIVVAVGVSAGALIAAFALCGLWSRFKRHSLPPSFPSAYPPAKLGTIFLPNPTNSDKVYETQMLEMPMSEEDMTLKERQASGDSRDRDRVSYRNYGREVAHNFEGDFSIEESLYVINGRFDPQTNRVQSVAIPSPDYPAFRRLI